MPTAPSVASALSDASAEAPDALGVALDDPLGVALDDPLGVALDDARASGVPDASACCTSTPWADRDTSPEHPLAMRATSTPTTTPLPTDLTGTLTTTLPHHLRRGCHLAPRH
ncbi:MAG: hypothetical protein NTU77_13075 [Actinobacteria bacterium]|nr:hypothetical protein [Actinomycetota bacterium]